MILVTTENENDGDSCPFEKVWIFCSTLEPHLIELQESNPSLALLLQKHCFNGGSESIWKLMEIINKCKTDFVLRHNSFKNCFSCV